jgi:hypothetical protein
MNDSHIRDPIVGPSGMIFLICAVVFVIFTAVLFRSSPQSKIDVYSRYGSASFPIATSIGTILGAVPHPVQVEHSVPEAFRPVALSVTFSDGGREIYVSDPLNPPPTRFKTLAWMNPRTGKIVEGEDAEALWYARNAAVMDLLIPVKPDIDWVARGDISSYERAHVSRYVSYFREMKLESGHPALVSPHSGLEVSFNNGGRDIFVQIEGRPLWYSLMTRRVVDSSVVNLIPHWMRVARFPEQNRASYRVQ